MNEYLNYYIKLSTKSFLTFLKINGLSVLSTIITFGTAYYFYTNADANISVQKPYLTLVLIAILVIPVFIFILVNQYSFQKYLTEVLFNHKDKPVEALIDKIISEITENQNLIKTSTEFAEIKLKAVNKINNQTTNRIMKKIILLGFNKLEISENELNNPNLKIDDILKTKIIDKLKNYTEPNFKTISLLFTIQWFLLIFMKILTL